MTTTTYQVVGKRGLPRKSHTYLRRRLPKSRTIHIKARRVNLDELSIRRGKKPELLEFDYLIAHVFPGPPAFIGGTRLDTGEFLQLDLNTETVRFEVTT